MTPTDAAVQGALVALAKMVCFRTHWVMEHMTVTALHAASPATGGHRVHLPGAPAGVRITRTGSRRFQLLIRTGSVTAAHRVTVAVRRKRVRFTGGIDARTPDRVRNAVVTAAQLLRERYGDPVRVDLPVASPVRSVCRRVEADGTVVHRVRVASAALAGHHVAEIGANEAITYPPGRTVPATVVGLVEDVTARLRGHSGSPVMGEVA